MSLTQIPAARMIEELRRWFLEKRGVALSYLYDQTFWCECCVSTFARCQRKAAPVSVDPPRKMTSWLSCQAHRQNHWQLLVCAHIKSRFHELVLTCLFHFSRSVHLVLFKQSRPLWYLLPLSIKRPHVMLFRQSQILSTLNTIYIAHS